jgi:hypothetical protein
MKRTLLLFVSLVFLSFPATARTLTPIEMETLKEEVSAQFTQFLQLWQEERYFEMYEFGLRQSRQQLSVEEFATRMVELDWVPVMMEGEQPEVSFRYRTLFYVSTNLQFRHKTRPELQYAKRQSFLLLQEQGGWRLDLLQMIRTPYYSPKE